MKQISSFVLMFAICVSVSAILKDPKLAMYYSFDDISGKTIKDGSLSGNNGEIIIENPDQADIKFDEGKNGKAIRLDQGV